MDGFTSIPIQSAGNNTSAAKPPENFVAPGFNNAPYKDNAVTGVDGIEIVDESVPRKDKVSFGFLFPLSVLCLFASFGYFGYLVFIRFVTLEKIALISDEFQVLSANINKQEIDEFLALDNSLKAINQKIQTHTQLAGILGFVNSNIRTSVQITDYRIENREKEVSVGLSSIAPTFRELAEQTEKMAELKSVGAIKDFQVTQMSLEADGRRIRYTLNLIFDKSKISVSALSSQSNPN